MNPVEYIKICFRKYADFSGRAGRPDIGFCLRGAVLSVPSNRLDGDGVDPRVEQYHHVAFVAAVAGGRGAALARHWPDGMVAAAGIDPLRQLDSVADNGGLAGNRRRQRLRPRPLAAARGGRLLPRHRRPLCAAAAAGCLRRIRPAPVYAARPAVLYAVRGGTGVGGCAVLRRVRRGFLMPPNPETIRREGSTP